MRGPEPWRRHDQVLAVRGWPYRREVNDIMLEKSSIAFVQLAAKQVAHGGYGMESAPADLAQMCSTSQFASQNTVDACQGSAPA